MRNFLKKIQLIICLTGIILMFSACMGTSETIDVNAWKDKLLPSSEADVAMGEGIKDTAGKVVNSAQEIADKVSEEANNSKNTVSDVNQLLGSEDNKEKDGFFKGLGKVISDMLKSWGKEGSDKVDIGSFSGNNSDGYYTEEVTPSDTTIKEDAASTEKGRLQVGFVRAVDGDTIIVEYKGNHIRVRLIGINTPESVASEEYLQSTGKENTKEGVIASNFMKKFMEGKKSIWLEFDTELEDGYGRALAYVWLSSDGTNVSTDMLNGILLKEQQAEVMAIEPNTKYKEELENAAVN